MLSFRIVYTCISKMEGIRIYVRHCTLYSTKYVHIKSTTVYALRRNWDSPQPPTRRLVCPLPPVSGGRGTLAGEKGVGRVPIPTRGIHCGTLYMYVFCAVQCREKERVHIIQYLYTYVAYTTHQCLAFQ
jgi:hypothetical protein